MHSPLSPSLLSQLPPSLSLICQVPSCPRCFWLFPVHSVACPSLFPSFLASFLLSSHRSMPVGGRKRPLTTWSSSFFPDSLLYLVPQASVLGREPTAQSASVSEAQGVQTPPEGVLSLPSGFQNWCFWKDFVMYRRKEPGARQWAVQALVLGATASSAKPWVLSAAQLRVGNQQNQACATGAGCQVTGDFGCRSTVIRLLADRCSEPSRLCFRRLLHFSPWSCTCTHGPWIECSDTVQSSQGHRLRAGPFGLRSPLVVQNRWKISFLKVHRGNLLGLHPSYKSGFHDLVWLRKLLNFHWPFSSPIKWGVKIGDFKCSGLIFDGILNLEPSHRTVLERTHSFEPQGLAEGVVCHQEP